MLKLDMNTITVQHHQNWLNLGDSIVNAAISLKHAMNLLKINNKDASTSETSDEEYEEALDKIVDHIYDHSYSDFCSTTRATYNGLKFNFKRILRDLFLNITNEDGVNDVSVMEFFRKTITDLGRITIPSFSYDGCSIERNYITNAIPVEHIEAVYKALNVPFDKRGFLDIINGLIVAENIDGTYNFKIGKLDLTRNSQIRN